MAVEIHREALACFWKARHRFGVAAALDDLTCSLGARGSDRAAMRVAGAAAGLRESMGIGITSQDRLDLETYLGPARQRLGEAVADALVAEGRAMTLEEAVGEALAGRTDDPC
jgi:hypothetical protein